MTVVSHQLSVVSFNSGVQATLAAQWQLDLPPVWQIIVLTTEI
jgi:hypothetical protein